MQLREAMDGEAQRRGKWRSTLKISSSHLRKLIVIFLCLPLIKLVVKLISIDSATCGQHVCATPSTDWTAKPGEFKAHRGLQPRRAHQAPTAGAPMPRGL